MECYELIREVIDRDIKVEICADGRLKATPLDRVRPLLDEMKRYRFAVELLAGGYIEARDGTFRVFPSCRALLETGEQISDDPETKACFTCLKGDPLTVQDGYLSRPVGLCSEKRAARAGFMKTAAPKRERRRTA